MFKTIKNQLILLLISCFSIMNMNAQDLKKHQWENRIIIIKATDIASKKQQQQLKEFRDASEEMIDRRFVVYVITRDDFRLINYKNSALNTSGKISEKLKNSLNPKEDFEVFLIGLDSGIKLQQTEVLTKIDLFKIVDSMPMRRNELRKN
ncbi:DUF4174 domain-containing protein [Kordia sp. YSTF-M3]|uniref:DUF4174 domain-containing protein n=2 Tax=Kordia aestuariivivens TaxID=2759037 RepID=A0ABR7QCF4_9FLAO|nr:DUF4174 domain-containing protein [Kordia aestuariivivens]